MRQILLPCLYANIYDLDTYEKKQPPNCDTLRYNSRFTILNHIQFPLPFDIYSANLQLIYIIHNHSK